MRFLASSDADRVFGTPEERVAQSREIAELHSFSARARQLIVDAEEARERKFLG